MFVLCELVRLHRTSRAESDGLSNPDIKLFVFVFCWAWYPGFGTKAEADDKQSCYAEVVLLKTG